MCRLIWQVTDSGVVIRLRVIPKASSNKIAGVYKDAEGNMSLKVSTTAQPEKGKANKAVIGILSKTFGKAKSVFSVKSGQTARNKTVLIAGDAGEVKKWLLPKLEEFENG